MDDGFKRLMARIEKFEQTHTKVHLYEQEKIVKALFKQLKQDFEGEAIIKVKKMEDCITIRLIIQHDLLACDEANSLMKLVALSNLFYIKRMKDRLKIELWFRLWEWK